MSVFLHLLFIVTFWPLDKYIGQSICTVTDASSPFGLVVAAKPRPSGNRSLLFLQSVFFLILPTILKFNIVLHIERNETNILSGDIEIIVVAFHAIVYGISSSAVDPRLAHL